MSAPKPPADGFVSRFPDTRFDALLVVSFGGPEGPGEVLPFLENVTRGRGVPRERLEEVAHHYELFGGVSPLNAQNRELTLGGWANPHAEAERQMDFLAAKNFCAEYFLTQVVSHHDAVAVERFVRASARRGVSLPGVFGVFYYRSANPKTLNALRSFLPVPIEGLTRDFAEGATPVDVCARTIRTLRDAGAVHFYISNLPIERASQVLDSILEKARI